MYQVRGKWAFITGAARGIGYLTACFMAEQGCNLILHSRSLSHTEKVLEEVRAKGVSAFAVAAELSDPEAVKKMLEEIDFPEELIVNASMDRLNDYLEKYSGAKK